MVVLPFRCRGVFVLSLPGYFSEFLAMGVLGGCCGCSFRFFSRVFLALVTRGAARDVMFVVVLMSRFIVPCSVQAGALYVGCVALESYLWHGCDVFAGLTATTCLPF